MKMLGAFLYAFRKPYTYDVRRNSYLWLGVFWGILIPSFIFAFDVGRLEPGAKGPLEVLRASPTHLVMLIQSAVLGILFGAMGSVRHDMETENERLIRNLRELAMTDSLTGLYNRRFIAEALKNMLETARRTREPLSVVLIDLDGFKSVNDEQGHVQGDRVLCDVAAALKSALRLSDVLGRHGGDEFILVGLSDRAAAGLLMERVAHAVRSRTGLELSAGIGCWPEDGGTAEDLVAAADRDLGASKKSSHESRVLPRAKGLQDEFRLES